MKNKRHESPVMEGNLIDVAKKSLEALGHDLIGLAEMLDSNGSRPLNKDESTLLKIAVTNSLECHSHEWVEMMREGCTYSPGHLLEYSEKFHQTIELARTVMTYKEFEV